MKFHDFPIYIYIGNNPKWRTPSFFRGVGIPPTSIGIEHGPFIEFWPLVI